MERKIWTALANELAEASAEAGRSIVGVQGGRHASSGMVIAADAMVTASHAVRRDEDIAVITADGKKIGPQKWRGVIRAVIWRSYVWNIPSIRRWFSGLQPTAYA